MLALDDLSDQQSHVVSRLVLDTHLPDAIWPRCPYKRLRCKTQPQVLRFILISYNYVRTLMVWMGEVHSNSNMCKPLCSRDHGT